MATSSERIPDPAGEWRSYVDDEEPDDLELPDPFVGPPPDPRAED